MSNEFFDYLEQSRTAWISQYWADDVVVRANAGWHFCFAMLAIGPAAKHRIYSFGDISRFFLKPSHVLTVNEFQSHYFPSTEQFYGGNGQTQHPLEIVSAANGRSRSATAVIVCDVNGRLWTYSGIPSFQEETYNQLGIGPVAGEFLGFANNFRTEKTARAGVTPVYGQQGDLINVKFSQVGVADRRPQLNTPDSVCFTALDSTGALWVSGTACQRNLAAVEQFPEDAGGVLAYFRKAEFYSYVDATGTVTLDDPLRFIFHAVGPLQIMAISEDGKLYLWGSFWFGQEIISATPHEVSGFVDSVTITNGGSGYNANSTTATASDPDNANGIKATLEVSVLAGAVVGIRITNSGCGYVAPPTITIAGAGTGATASAALFDRTWLYASCSRHTKSFSAIDSNGKLYCWGPRSPAVREADTPTLASPVSPMAAAYQSANGYVQVERSQTGGILLTTDGSIHTWGDSSETPQLTNQERLTSLISGNTYVQVATSSNALAALTDGGQVFTSGDRVQCGRGFTSSQRLTWGPVEGSAVWLSLFGGMNGFILNREEEFDSDGNRIEPIPPGLT